MEKNRVIRKGGCTDYSRNSKKYHTLMKKCDLVAELQNGENVLMVAARTGQVSIVRDFANEFDLEDTDAVCFSSMLLRVLQ